MRTDNTHEREGLPELPASAASFRYVTACERQLVFPRGYRDEFGDEFFTADQMRAYGRLCRAGREDMPDVGETADQAMALANFFEGIRVFVTTRERIKHPEGTDLFDEHVTKLILLAAKIRRLSPQAGGES